MGDIAPENSFPQICVVSVVKSLRVVEIRQEYEGSVATHATASLFPQSHSAVSHSASPALAERAS